MLRRIFTVVVIAVALVFATTASAFAFTRDDALPGVPIGQGTISGAVDTVDKTDIYAVQLYDGQSVTLRLSDPSGGWDQSRLLLWSPDVPDIPDDYLSSDWDYLVDDALIMGSDAVIKYTASRSAVYYVQVLADANANAYTLSITGSASLPSNATQWTDGAAPGFGLSPTYGHSTTLWGKLSPTFCSLGLPQTTAALQESSDTVSWSPVTSPSSTAGQFYYPVTVTQKCYYRWVFSGDGVYASSTSPLITVIPTVPTTGVLGNKSTVKKNHAYAFYGYIGQKTTATVWVQKYNTKKRKFVAYASYHASVSASASSKGFRFTRSLRLGAAKYRMRVVTGTPSGFHSGTSAYRTVTFK
jgi:hypothetical protein